MPGYTSVHQTSPQTGPVLAGTIVSKTLPSITGGAQKGHTLTAQVGAWTPGGLTYTYQWLKDGKNIPGAHKRTYQLAASAKGHRFSVRVTVKALINLTSATTRSSGQHLRAAGQVDSGPRRRARDRVPLLIALSWKLGYK